MDFPRISIGPIPMTEAFRKRVEAWIAEGHVFYCDTDDETKAEGLIEIPLIIEETRL
jgi:hypothetical protein